MFATISSTADRRKKTTGNHLVSQCGRKRDKELQKEQRLWKMMLKLVTLALAAVTFSVLVDAEVLPTAMDCLLEEDAFSCARERIGKELDEIEVQVTGKDSEAPVSRVLEEAGELVGDGVQAILGISEVEDVQDEEVQEDGSRGIEEARKKKLGKKKKKALQQFIMVAMLIKAKISLLLQLLSTHLQVKFFALSIISLLLNAARFWIDLKKGHEPSKVIYYEHAQHQHHYDHEDEHTGYWGRSTDEDPQDIAYSAHVHDH